MIKSYNGFLICEPYIGKVGIKSRISSGVATPEQKTSVVGLRVLKDAKINDTIYIKEGSVVYIKEEILHTNKETYTTQLKCSDVKEPFVLAIFDHVSFVEEK